MSGETGYSLLQYSTPLAHPVLIKVVTIDFRFSPNRPFVAYPAAPANLTLHRTPGLRLSWIHGVSGPPSVSLALGCFGGRPRLPGCHCFEPVAFRILALFRLRHLSHRVVPFLTIALHCEHSPSATHFLAYCARSPTMRCTERRDCGLSLRRKALTLCAHFLRLIRICPATAGHISARSASFPSDNWSSSSWLGSINPRCLQTVINSDSVT